MDSKDLDVKMKIRRIINTPGISDRTIIGKIQGDKGVGKLINTLNQKLEEEIKDEEKITTIKLVNPVKVTNPDVTIYDCPNYQDYFNNAKGAAYFEINNKKIKVIYNASHSFYNKEINVEMSNPKTENGTQIRDMLTIITISRTVYLQLSTYITYLVTEGYLTQEEISANSDDNEDNNKIVAINIRKPLCLTNEYLEDSYLTIIDKPTITPSKISATVGTLFGDKNISALRYAPTFLFMYPEISTAILFLESSTISSNGQKIVFKPIYAVNGIFYPILTYIGENNEELLTTYKWSLEINIKAYS